jgi:uncharacterized membrane protein YfhO
LHLVVRTSRPGWLVVPNVWDEGWEARIDGHPEKVVRANYFLQAVLIRAGGGDVVLEYKPSGIWVGLAITVASVSAALAALVLIRLRLSRRL